MPITPEQMARAEERQWAAARDTSPRVLLVAGPGTGKTHTIQKRVKFLLETGGRPRRICIISFTRASVKELSSRIVTSLVGTPFEDAMGRISISTMHSLALRLLKLGRLLNRYPSQPVVLDRWEQKNIYDAELAETLGIPNTRAREIRRAYEAAWQTLDPDQIDQARVTEQERTAFLAFHGSRANLYSCVLPGEVIHQCVDNAANGTLRPSEVFPIDDLIVDEFQDLNACDQEFMRILAQSDATSMVAGDDDQSIYSSLRHADPGGLVELARRYPDSVHTLEYCFRCAPQILNAAGRLIRFNPGRIDKTLTSLYASSAPPVNGTLAVWSFPSAEAEARAIAGSCLRLVESGMAGREDEILILISDRELQLDMITRELANLGLPFETPAGEELTDDEGIRAAYCVFRIVRDLFEDDDDYPAYRALLGLLPRIGPGRAKNLAELCIRNRQNFRDLFHLSPLPGWLEGPLRAAVEHVSAVVQAVSEWALDDELVHHRPEMHTLLAQHIFYENAQDPRVGNWEAFADGIPETMTLEEVCDFLGAVTEAERRSVLDDVQHRIGEAAPETVPAKRIRILTMHGAKGLSGKVVFIPSAEQGIMPSERALRVTGQLIEQRRLFYMSMTRAMAACIVSHAATHRGAVALRLEQRPVVRMTRSQFLNEIGVQSLNSVTGLTPEQAARIVADINNLGAWRP